MAGLGVATTTPSDGFLYCHSERVRLGHTDAQGILYHGTYLVLCEAARAEFMRDIGVDYVREVASEGLDFAVAGVSLKFHAPAVYDDILDIWIRIPKVQRVQFVCHHEIRHRNSNLLMTTVEMHIACLNPAKRRPARIPLPVLEAFRAHSGEWMEDLTAKREAP